MNKGAHKKWNDGITENPETRNSGKSPQILEDGIQNKFDFCTVGHR